MTTIVSKAWSLTAGGISNSRSLAEPSCLGMGTEIGGPEDSGCASVANSVVGARSTPTTGTMFNGEILKSTRQFQ